MAFTSYKYGVFVFLAFGVFWLVAQRSRRVWFQNLALLVVSYGFYALWDPRWCLLLLGITISGFIGARAIEAGSTDARRRTVLGAVIVLNLGALGLFKYFDFFSGSFVDLLANVHVRADEVTLGLMLPLGLSYYVFQNLSYVIDVYRRRAPATREALSFAVALSFFPQLLAGPITRPLALLPQLERPRTFDDDLARDGLRQILWGLTKKMLIADNIALQVDHIWATAGAQDGLTLMIGALLYSVQIYCDFSGYADIAIGTAKLFNLRLSPNFAYPYFAGDIQQFWRCWHMTLSSWMRDYVYIPLGGSRVVAWRQALNVMVTFFVVGLWHGANLTFVVWGLLHGSYVLVWGWLQQRRGKARSTRTWPAALGGLVTFGLVTFAWVFFRAPSFDAAVGYLSRALSTPYAAVDHLRYLPSLVAAAALLGYEALTRRWEHGLSISRWPLPIRWAAYAGACFVLLIAGYLGDRAGIYVRF